MTANDDNTAGTIPGTIRDPVTAANILRVNADGSINATIAGVVGSSISQPGGRLTLVTATPVLTSDQTAKSTVFYDSYIGNSVPIYNGTSTAPVLIGSDQISLALNTTDNTSTNLYDIFAFSSSGTLTLGTGPAWTSATARSAAISLKNGIWTNTASIALRAGGALLATVAANQATYLGTIYCTANGQTGMAFKPAAASGGTNNILGLYNAYNRVRVIARSQDSTTSWSYNSATWRVANGAGTGSGLLNRISYVDGLAQSFVGGDYTVACQNSTTANNAPAIGLNQDATTGAPDSIAIMEAGSTAAAAFSSVNSISTNGSWSPSLGFHFIQAMEQAANAGTGTFFGVNASSGYQNIRVMLDM